MLGYKKNIKNLIVCAVSLSWASTLYAAENQFPQPFSASYEINWKGGLSFEGDTRRQLSLDENQSWAFKSKASALFASITESSNFLWQAEKPVPLNYLYKKKALGKKRTAEVTFDWDNLEVTNNVANKPWQMAIHQGVQDKLSYQLLLQYELSQGKSEFTYTVADGGKLKEYRFEIDGRELVQAPIGEYEAVRVKRIRSGKSERKTFIWFAPDLDYQIIKLHQIEKKDKSYTLLLKELKL